MLKQSSRARDFLRRTRRLSTRLAPVAAAASAALLLWHAAHDSTRAAGTAPAPLIYPQSPAAGAAVGAAPTSASAAPARNAPAGVQQAGIASTIEVVVGRNDTLDRIFRRLALDKGDLAAIRDLPGIRQSLDMLKPGEAISLTHTAGELKELTRKVSDTQTLKVVRRADGFTAQMISDPVETRIRAATATIDSSLFQAAADAHMSDAIALKLADIFAWDIDFVLDIRPGDRFTAVYQQIYQDGKYLRDGEVLAAEFVNDGRVYRAVRFVGADGRIGYYTPGGQPMRKAFLRAPLAFTRVSSVFNPRRMHPILHRIRGHMGTDYAAPTGTPVHASGDGRVSFVGWEHGYGNTIILAHGDRITTLYGHLSRFAKHLHRGEPVQQGEVIGYVGMTGLATGPHLHYEYRVNGVHENPQTVRLPGAPALRDAALRQFRAEEAPLVADLGAPPQRAAVQLAANAAHAPDQTAPRKLVN